MSNETASSKVCHKCAFEIEQCNTFVEKVKTSSKSSKRGCCILCSDAFNKETFFDLSKQKSGVDDFVQRIRDLFTEEVSIAGIVDGVGSRANGGFE